MTTEPPTPEIAVQVKELLAKDKIAEAIDILFQHLKSDKLLNEVVVQSAIFKRLSQSLKQNTIQWEKSSMIKNQVIISVLGIVDSLGKNESQEHLYRDVFSELDSLSVSIRDLPKKDNKIVQLINFPIRLFLVVIAMAIAFGTGISIGNTSFSKRISPANSQEEITPPQEPGGFTISGFKNESKYVRGIEFLRFYNQSGSQFDFSGQVGILQCSGTATKNGNTISVKGNNISGDLTLVNDETELTGSLKLVFPNGSEPMELIVDYKLVED